MVCIRPKHSVRALKRKHLYPYLYLLPAIALLVGVLGYSWLGSLKTSFYRWEPFVSPDPVFRGLGNYVELLRDRLFLKTLKNTFIFTAGSVSLQFAFGFAIALLLNKISKLRGFITTCCMLPYVIAPVLTALMWKLLMDVDIGFLNYFLNAIGVPSQLWVSGASSVLPSLMLVYFWAHTPFVMIFMLAGLQALPQEPFEAAKIDGATRFQILRHLTIPLLRPLMAIVLLFQTTFALRVFGIVFTLAPAGGPQKNGMLLGIYLYNRAFRPFRLGFGAAVSFVILLITLLGAIGYLLVLYREREF